jgi:hypothetical protein
VGQRAEDGFGALIAPAVLDELDRARELRPVDLGMRGRVVLGGDEVDGPGGLRFPAPDPAAAEAAVAVVDQERLIWL